MTLKAKILWPVAVGLVTVGLLHEGRPRLEIEPIPSVGSWGLFPDQFRIRNMGTLPLYDVGYNCADYSATGMAMVLDQPTVRFLDAGQSFTIRCGRHDPGAAPPVLGTSGGYRFVSDVEISVGARPSYVWYREGWKERFIGVKEPNRAMIWVRQPLRPSD